MSETEADKGTQDVDAILNEYEQGTQQQSKEPEGFNEVLSYVRSQQQETNEKAIQESLSGIKGNLKVSDEVARGFLEYQAAKDKSIAKAFEERNINQSGWQDAQKRLNELFIKQFPDVDEQATNDTNELVAAVANSQQSKPQPEQEVDFKGMSSDDFRKYQMEIMSKL